jgi:hypothetical protein
MRYAAAGVVAFLASITGVLAARPGGASPPSSTPAGTTSRTPPFLVSLTARTAANNCDAQPDGASYVWTTRQKAEAMSGDGVDSNQPVYLVLLRGDFVDYYAHGIYRTRDAFPRGTAITFTVDAAKRGILDFGIGSQEPDLAQLGTVHDFLGELRAAPAIPSPPVCG